MCPVLSNVSKPARVAAMSARRYARVPGRAGAVCANAGASGILNNSASQLQRVDRAGGSSICDV